MNINEYTPDLARYIPKVLSEVKEFKALCDSENPEFDCAWDAVRSVLNDQFIDTLTINGIERWENILKITPAGSFEDRRLLIKARLNSDGAYTLEKLKSTLAAVCGEDGYTCVLNSEQYRLTVRIALTSGYQYDSVKDLLDDVVPANLIIDLSLAYNQHQMLTKYTHNDLVSLTHTGIREEPLPAIGE